MAAKVLLYNMDWFADASWMMSICTPFFIKFFLIWKKYENRFVFPNILLAVLNIHIQITII